jgi:methylmalonyl-CoA/ethylmalonyl-CoA epimerase
MIGGEIDHVGLVVGSIEEAAPLYEQLLGEAISDTVDVPGLGLRLAFVGSIELMEPTGGDSLVGKLLEEHGPSMHHVAYRTADLVGTLARLREAGVALFDETPRMGAHGRLVAFLHPRSTGGTLIELVEVGAP